MAVGLDHPITEICLLVQDVERSIAFYEKLGFKQQRRGDGFVSFTTAGLGLALWESAHVAENVGFPAAEIDQLVHKVMTAFRVESSDIVESIYPELVAAGISILSPPKTYDNWNAHCIYFADPDGNAWEVYAWAEGGEDGIKNSVWV